MNPVSRTAVLTLVLTAAAIAAARPAAAALTPAGLRRALAAKPTGEAAARLAEEIRAWFGADALKSGGVKADETDVAWAIEAPGAKTVRVTAVFRSFGIALEPVGTTGLFAVAAAMPDGTALRWAFEVDGRRSGGGELEVYSTPPEERERPGVPRGTVKPLPKWRSRIHYKGTERDLWIYVPAQARPVEPAAVMVFTDGEAYVNYVPTVFDNLIARGDMPVTVGVFVTPGVFTDGRRGRSNRSFEYDTLSDTYARFLLEEVLPEAEKHARLSRDPEMRAVVGASSGGICSFTVAWERPNEFRKVLSQIGSFTNIAAGKSLREGGHNYQALVRKTPRKPIRVFLQDGENDLNNEHGNWTLANMEMESALRWAGYDVRAVWGHGFHNRNHGRAILPDALRWLWRDHARAR